MKRDLQKQRVYDWETLVVSPVDTTKVPFESIHLIVNYVWEQEGLQYPPQVERLPKNTRRHAGDATRLVVRFQETTKTWIILHELAHSMTSKATGESNHHGALFLGIYMNLLNKYLKIPISVLIHTATKANLEFNLAAKPVFVQD